MGALIQFTGSFKTSKQATVKHLAVSGGHPIAIQKQGRTCVAQPNAIIDMLDQFDRAEQIIEKRQATDPLVNMSDINKIVSYFLSKGSIRDVLLFVAGCNFGLRISDLLDIKFRTLYSYSDETGYTVRDMIPTKETKNGNIKKVYVNDAVKKIATLYIQQESGLYDFNMEDYIFSNNSYNITYEQYVTADFTLAIRKEHMKRQTAAKIIREGVKKAGITHPGRHYSTHSMRKTCGWQAAITQQKLGIDPTTLEVIRQFMGHSSIDVTQRYLNYVDMYMPDLYLHMNVGLDSINEYISDKCMSELVRECR